MRSSLVRPMGALIAAIGFFGVARSADPVAAEQLEALHSLIKPAASEDRWAAIPWRTSLWEARQEAAKSGKPIVLWEMDGHPLGCV